MRALVFENSLPRLAITKVLGSTRAGCVEMSMKDEATLGLEEGMACPSC
jgi:hypothetical protein